MTLYQRSSKCAKVNISESIVATTRKQNGRLLEKQQHDVTTTATGGAALWFDIGDVRAIQQTSQASSRKRQQEQHQQQSQGKRRRHQQSALNSMSTTSATIHPLDANVQQPYKENKKKNKHNKLVSWEERRKQLDKYKNTVGHTNVPQGYEKNKQLGVWVQTQRTHYRLLKQGKSSLMTEERIRSLNELEFNWQVYKEQDKRVPWEERRKELDKYKNTVGHTNVPQGYEKNKQLATWVTTQRTQYRLLKQGKSSAMTEERIRSLNELEFSWRYREQGKRVSWEERRKQLENYKNAVGNPNIPRGYKKNKPLAAWVNTQRTQYKLVKQGKSSSMTEERIRSLNELEFNWQLYTKKRAITKATDTESGLASSELGSGAFTLSSECDKDKDKESPRDYQSDDENEDLYLII